MTSRCQRPRERASPAAFSQFASATNGEALTTGWDRDWPGCRCTRNVTASTKRTRGLTSLSAATAATNSTVTGERRHASTSETEARGPRRRRMYAKSPLATRSCTLSRAAHQRVDAGVRIAAEWHVREPGLRPRRCGHLRAAALWGYIPIPRLFVSSASSSSVVNRYQAARGAETFVSASPSSSSAPPTFVCSFGGR
jgi:hypothetical protein